MAGANVTVSGLLPAILLLSLMGGELLRLLRGLEVLGGPGLVVGRELPPDRRHLVLGFGDRPGEPGDLLLQLSGPLDLLSTLRV